MWGGGGGGGIGCLPALEIYACDSVGHGRVGRVQVGKCLLVGERVCVWFITPGCCSHVV